MLSHFSVPLCVALWTVTSQAPLSMGFPKNTGVGCHSLLQGIFPTQGSSRCLLGLTCSGGWVLYPWHYLGSPKSRGGVTAKVVRKKPHCPLFVMLDRILHCFTYSSDFIARLPLLSSIKAGTWCGSFTANILQFSSVQSLSHV